MAISGIKKKFKHILKIWWLWHFFFPQKSFERISLLEFLVIKWQNLIKLNSYQNSSQLEKTIIYLFINLQCVELDLRVAMQAS
jgi:hypothetical protein